MATEPISGTCRICGREKTGLDFNAWVKDTFTNHDLLLPGDIICDSCLFWFDYNSVELQQRMGKDKPQRMLNYSHFIKGGLWFPFSKSNKAGMADMLAEFPFPEIAAVAESGQKHIVFRARMNPAGQAAGWIQFEEQSLWVEQSALCETLAVVNDLYRIFSKTEIETGKYYPANIIKFGIDPWRAQEEKIRRLRGGLLLKLCLFLAQRKEENDGRKESGHDGDAAAFHLGGRPGGVQEQIPDDDLGAVRERDSGGGLHQQPLEIHQLDLFAVERDPGEQPGGTGRD